MLGILSSMLQGLQHFQHFILIKIGQWARYVVHNLLQRTLRTQLIIISKVWLSLMTSPFNL